MTDDYIKREDALTGLEDSDIGFCDDEPIQTRNSALKIIQNIPAADVRPVVHGKWVKSKMSAWGYRQWYECSECGEPVFPSYGHPARTNFCHNCGAKMKEWTHDD